MYPDMLARPYFLPMMMPICRPSEAASLPGCFLQSTSSSLLKQHHRSPTLSYPHDPPFREYYRDVGVCEPYDTVFVAMMEVKSRGRKGWEGGREGRSRSR